MVFLRTTIETIYVMYYEDICNCMNSLDGVSYTFPLLLMICLLGTMVVSNLYASCQDPSVYPDPEVFKPDRFLDSDGCFKKPDKKYMNPFGTGRHASYFLQITDFVDPAEYMGCYNCKSLLQISLQFFL